MDRPPQESDGSTEIHFSPEKPEGAANWLKTIPGRGYFVIIRLYGPDEPYFDETWKPDDIVKVG